MPIPITPQAARAILLAQYFVALLRRDLSTPKFHKMRLDNRLESSPHVCHSHDWLDANMTMDEAFTLAFGHSPLDDDQRDPVDDGMTGENCALWNAAWDYAKAVYLTAGRP